MPRVILLPVRLCLLERECLMIRKYLDSFQSKYYSVRVRAVQTHDVFVDYVNLTL